MAPHRSTLRTALVTVPLVLLLGLASGWVSNSGYGNPWFDALTKPDVMPPGWAFGAAWTTLYILLGFALALVVAAPDVPARKPGLALFAIQMLLNYAWSPVFFGAHRILGGLVLIMLILLLAAVTAILFARTRPLAGVLMLPYLAWLGFATFLNYRIMLLNPGA